jgi:hypothetical protein
MTRITEQLILDLIGEGKNRKLPLNNEEIKKFILEKIKMGTRKLKKMRSKGLADYISDTWHINRQEASLMAIDCLIELRYEGKIDRIGNKYYLIGDIPKERKKYIGNKLPNKIDNINSKKYLKVLKKLQAFKLTFSQITKKTKLNENDLYCILEKLLSLHLIGIDGKEKPAIYYTKINKHEIVYNKLYIALNTPKGYIKSSKPREKSITTRVMEALREFGPMNRAQISERVYGKKITIANKEYNTLGTVLWQLSGVLHKDKDKTLKMGYIYSIKDINDKKIIKQTDEEKKIETNIILRFIRHYMNNPLGFRGFNLDNLEQYCEGRIITKDRCTEIFNDLHNENSYLCQKVTKELNITFEHGDKDMSRALIIKKDIKEVM